MNKIELTDENRDLYQQYYDIKKGGVLPIDHQVLFEVVIIATIIGLCIISGGIGFLGARIVAHFTNSELATLISLIGLAAVSVAAGFGGIQKLGEKWGVKKFKRDHPEIDTDVDIKELGKALDKVKEEETNELVKRETKKYHDYISDEVQDMTIQEKIAFLTREREFWEQELNRVKGIDGIDNVQDKRPLTKTNNNIK